MVNCTGVIVRRLVAAAAVVVAIGSTAGCAADDGGSQSVFAVSVGDCLNDAGQSGNVDSVPVVDCAEPHDSEVYYEFDATGEMYPSDDDLAAQADEGCRAAFADFVGIAYGESHYQYATYTPLLASWYDDGGKEISCVIFDPDGQTTGSLEAIGA
ncbi:septum formation family protein [Herbiconiux ginsengi]|uniref:Septum formation n=1 Tax=Herbiconiux ginsengi TaxID=381665 RepID=A0A1H3Q4L7_9MICO|nr:septum formation family protein [Herbiconiux ginsengi]SDZ08454.1 Septum formation [Herbiconiux ginsengi]